MRPVSPRRVPMLVPRLAASPRFVSSLVSSRARVRKLCKSYGIDEDSPRAALLILQRRRVAPAAAPVTVKKKSSSNGSSNVVAKKKSITLSIKPKQQQHHQSRSSSHHSPSTTHLNDVAAVLATHDSQPGPQSQVASRPAVDEDYDKCSSPGSSDEEDEEEELRRRRSLWEACQDIVGEPCAFSFTLVGTTSL